MYLSVHILIAKWQRRNQHLFNHSTAVLKTGMPIYLQHSAFKTKGKSLQLPDACEVTGLLKLYTPLALKVLQNCHFNPSGERTDEILYHRQTKCWAVWKWLMRSKKVVHNPLSSVKKTLATNLLIWLYLTEIWSSLISATNTSRYSPLWSKTKHLEDILYKSIKNC